MPCGTTGATCAKNIFIKTNSINIALKRGLSPTVNDSQITDLVLGSRVFGDVTLMKSGLYVFIITHDFTIKWDEKTRIYVTVRSNLQGQMAGLCGDFNKDSRDDTTFVTFSSSSSFI